ncbi:probable phospholipid-transporting ATPase 8 [Typha angustifolia]|uniref:probable phospholipid-transporting ATPase 8 n=1 Tax=Typha angustifolia TaxID=59011 RepID=UPI003C2F75EA
MAGERRKRPLHLFELTSLFGRRLPPSIDSAGGGYSRVVHCNDPGNQEAARLGYCANSISTTKYTAANFVPKSLFEQFRRAANIFFLIIACISFSPLAPYRAVSILLPLVVVTGATMAKEAVEDWRRKQQDIEVNNRKVGIYDGTHSFHQTEWEKLQVGDIVKVEKDEYFPADLLLLSSSYEDGLCYVETMNLDGETNLKRKQSLEVTSSLCNDHSFQKYKALVKCEDPNEKLYSFIGTMYHDDVQYPLSLQQILLRDSKLRNTQHIYGVVIFTGHDTKVMQNTMDPPSKRSNIERRMDKIVYTLFAILIILASVGSILFGIKTKEEVTTGSFRWYLRPDTSSLFFDPKRAGLAALCHFLTSLMLYGCLIPISLYISIEIVKVLQSTFINVDHKMYCEESDKPARARTSNLNEELGQVHTILSDKTGTLTCNSMEFLKCSIAGVAYGSGSSEVGKVLGGGKDGELLQQKGLPSSFKGHNHSTVPIRPVKGFNFTDDRLMNGQWVKEPHSEVIQNFFRVLAICHTAIPVVNKKSVEISYEAESPDEAAFVTAARELGFEFFQRTQTSISLHEINPKIGRIDRTYKILNILEFSSARKRMSVIVRTEENQLLLFCKGADSVIFEKLSKEGQSFEAETKCHIDEYSEAGLRTLAVAYRILTEEDYRIWNDEFSAAKSFVNADRDGIVDKAAEQIEKDLILLGATAVEDRLQKGVPECINKLAQAGIKIWILTGDKLETAVNIGFACHLLRKEMKHIVIQLDTKAINGMKKGDEGVIHEIIANQIYEAQRQVSSLKGSSVLFALIIDGYSLAYALSGSLENSFLDLAVDCASVICCRISPKQKALITRLVKRRTRKTTLAIGDGTNDVGMLQEADIGVGISGVEGMQAVMSSDFAIAQFRFLERLLLVHGHWCYRRIAAMICYFFYKNITFGFTLFWFEAHAFFSGQPAYNDWYISFYSVAFTSLPVIALGVFDKDVSSRICLKFPLLHQDGIRNIYFSWPRILGWMLNGVCTSIMIFYFTTNAILDQAFRVDGHVAGSEILGVTMYTCVVWIVNCQLALYLSYFTWIQHLFIWGSILFWYIFLVIYGSFPPTISTTAYWVFLETCASSPLYWLSSLFVVITALLPYFCYSTFQRTFFPKYRDIIQRVHLRNQ